jgi:hypothetical protein
MINFGAVLEIFNAESRKDLADTKATVGNLTAELRGWLYNNNHAVRYKCLPSSLTLSVHSILHSQHESIIHR